MRTGHSKRVGEILRFVIADQTRVGGIRDIRDLFRTIRTLKPDSSDNGMVAIAVGRAPLRVAEEKPKGIVDALTDPDVAPEVTAL